MMGHDLAVEPGAFEQAGRGLQHTGLRRANERAVLTVIAFNPGVSNAEISRLTGLAPQTVSAILLEVERAGLITRGAVLRGRRGQPATPIHLNPEGGYAIGVEISWRHADLVLINMLGEIVYQAHLDYAFPDAATLPATVVGWIEAARQAVPSGARGRIFDVGVAMPTNMGRYLAAAGAPAEQGPRWEALDIAGELARATGLEVTIFNDGNAACWAELLAQPRRPGNFVYLLVARFLAAGVVGEGTLWEGPTGNSANLGSMLVAAADGQLRPAHDIASLDALDRRLTAAKITLDRPLPCLADWEGLEPVLDLWIQDAARALAAVIYNTQTVLENRVIVIDGLMPRPVLDRLVAATVVALLRLPGAADWRPQISAGQVGRQAPAIGASELTIYKRYFSRSLADLAV